MNNYSNANSSGCASEQRNQNIVDTVGKFKSSYVEKRESSVKTMSGDSNIFNETFPPDLVNQFCGMKFSEERYASSKCRIGIADSHFHVAKKHLKKGDDIAALAYMQCSMNHASRAILELIEERDENHIDIMVAFEKMCRHSQANLFSRNDFLFLHELFYIFDKIARGDFFTWTRESFSEMLKKIEIFIRNAEKVLSVYYICTDKVIENSTGGNEHE